MPLVSVLMPVRNAAPTLHACLRSIQRQTLVSWECVVVDDGSSDGSLALLRQIAAADERFRIVATAHRGIVEALNTGLSACRGRYIARMDADDLMRRERLAKQAAALERKPELSGVGCHVRLFPRAHLKAGLLAYERWLLSIDSALAVERDAFIECPIAHPTLMLKREVFAAMPYQDRGWPEDYDLLLRLLLAGHRLTVVPERLLSWRDGPARLSRTGPAYAQQRFVACKAHYLSLSRFHVHPQYVLWGYGDTGRQLTRALAACGRHPSHIVELHRGRLGQKIAGARVIPPHELASVPYRNVVASVAGAGPRGEVRTALVGMGYVEGRDFVCAA
jgi:glycosyltransferase involved in cell wall biosynthesis